MLAALFLAIAILYASVGQAGASGYLAAMAFFAIAPPEMKLIALILNLVVSMIGTIQAWRSGLLSWRNFYPFAVLGFPFSLAGGAIHLPSEIYHPVVGLILLISAVQMARLAYRRPTRSHVPAGPPPFFPALLTGAVIGFVSGTTGTGGGIFLAPVILAMNWVELRRATAVTAAYNLLNSAAALAGAATAAPAIPDNLPLWLAAVALGGLVGTELARRRLPDRAIRLILAGLLALSGLKLILM